MLEIKRNEMNSFTFVKPFEQNKKKIGRMVRVKNRWEVSLNVKGFIVWG